MRLRVDATDARVRLRERSGPASTESAVVECAARYDQYRVVAEYEGGGTVEKRVAFGQSKTGLRAEGLTGVWWQPLRGDAVADPGWRWSIDVVREATRPASAPAFKPWTPPSQAPGRQTGSYLRADRSEETETAVGMSAAPLDEPDGSAVVRQLTPTLHEILQLSHSIWEKVSAPASAVPSATIELQRRIEQLEAENRLLKQSGRPEDQRELQVLRRKLQEASARPPVSSRSDLLARPLRKIIEAMGAAGTDAPGDRLTDDESRGLGQCLPYLQEVPEGPTAGELNDLARTLTEAAAHPLELARAALDDSAWASALEHLANHVSNQAIGVEAKGRRYYVDRLKVIAIQLWREHAGNQQLAIWLPKTLEILGLEMVVPEVGRTYSGKTQIAVDRRPGNESQPRNSILEIREPGFREKATGKFISKPKVVVASR